MALPNCLDWQSTYETVVETPDWATDLLDELCTRFEIVPPSLFWYENWKKANGAYYPPGIMSNGNAKIEIYAESDPMVDKMVLLHELAHAIDFERRGRSGHDLAFYMIAYPLYTEYNVITEALRYEYPEGKMLIANWERPQRIPDVLETAFGIFNDTLL